MKGLIKTHTIIILFLLNGLVYGQVWTEDSFEDFRDGTLDASGQNIYISKDGAIRTINRFDLNDDGWLDLVYPHTHDRSNIVTSTTIEISADGNLKQSELHVRGSKQVEVADLNNDGWSDLVFCPNHDGLQHPRRFVTMIYGGEDGWPASRSNGILPVYDAIAVSVADLNLDGWQDIITLNQPAWKPDQPGGNVVRTYWGSPSGYFLTNYMELGIAEAVSMVSGDFDGNGKKDIAILSDKNITLLWANEQNPNKDIVAHSISKPTGIFQGDVNNDSTVDLIITGQGDLIDVITGTSDRELSDHLAIKGHRASQVVVADLDSNGENDLILTYFNQQIAGGGELSGSGSGSREDITILWNGSMTTTHLEAHYARAVTTGDYNGDGHQDIALAIHQSDTNFITNSWIYYGKGNKDFEKSNRLFRTEGAYDITTVPPEHNKPNRLVVCNIIGGTVNEKIPVYIYWGGPDDFSVENRLSIPFRSGYESSAADLNADGFVDLMVLDELHSGGTDDPWGGINIFWGTANGLDIDSRTVVFEAYIAFSTIADINKDGYLDIAVGQYGNDDEDRQNTNITIFYGSKSGYSQDRREDVPCHGRSVGVQIADYDKDGWLDLVASSYIEQGVRIFYGSPDGYGQSRYDSLNIPNVGDLETADLNNDGWLDLIVGSYKDMETYSFDLGISLVWGGPNGFEEWNSQWLPGFCPLGPSVADWDGDGYLDLLVPHYHANGTREKIPCYLYWGGPDGFNFDNKSYLINDSGSDAVSGDFNKDGLLDLAVNNHTDDGSHVALSKVFYNDGNRFTNPRIVELPTLGPHWGSNTDMGHIYNRSWEQTYTSSIFNFRDKKKGQLSYVADIPVNASVEFLVRHAKSKEDLINQAWETVATKSFDVRGSRFIQYMAILKSDNGDSFPIIDKVTINLD